MVSWMGDRSDQHHLGSVDDRWYRMAPSLITFKGHVGLLVFGTIARPLGEALRPYFRLGGSWSSAGVAADLLVLWCGNSDLADWNIAKNSRAFSRHYIRGRARMWSCLVTLTTVGTATRLTVTASGRLDFGCVDGGVVDRRFLDHGWLASGRHDLPGPSWVGAPSPNLADLLVCRIAADDVAPRA